MRYIYFSNLCSGQTFEAASFVLADFKDAYVAYERMSSGTVEEPGFVFVDEATVKPADTALFAFDNADTLCESVSYLAPNTNVYGIHLGDALPSQAFAGVETACKRADCTWCGVLLITKEPDKIMGLKNKPRLGLRRRKLSEATDRLIACVRAHVSVLKAAELFGATKKQRVSAKRNFILA